MSWCTLRELAPARAVPLPYTSNTWPWDSDAGSRHPACVGHTRYVLQLLPISTVNGYNYVHITQNTAISSEVGQNHLAASLSYQLTHTTLTQPLVRHKLVMSPLQIRLMQPYHTYILIMMKVIHNYTKISVWGEEYSPMRSSAMAAAGVIAATHWGTRHE